MFFRITLRTIDSLLLSGQKPTIHVYGVDASTQQEAFELLYSSQTVKADFGAWPERDTYVVRTSPLPCTSVMRLR